MQKAACKRWPGLPRASFEEPQEADPKPHSGRALAPDCDLVMEPPPRLALCSRRIPPSVSHSSLSCPYSWWIS